MARQTITKLTDRRRGYVVCLDNAAYPASLERGKIYCAIADRAASDEGFIRVIDESGEDYLFPSQIFASVELPLKIRQALTTPPRRRKTTALRR